MFLAPARSRKKSQGQPNATENQGQGQVHNQVQYFNGLCLGQGKEHVGSSVQLANKNGQNQSTEIRQHKANPSLLGMKIKSKTCATTSRGSTAIDDLKSRSTRVKSSISEGQSTGS